MSSFLGGVLTVVLTVSVFYTICHLYKSVSGAKTFEDNVLLDIAELQSEQTDIKKSLADLHCRGTRFRIWQGEIYYRRNRGNGRGILGRCQRYGI